MAATPPRSCWSVGFTAQKSACDLRQITFRGRIIPIRIKKASHKRRGNKVRMQDGGIVIERTSKSPLQPERSLEKWLRREARREILKQLSVVTASIKRRPKNLYIMGQRTKWGNCSSKQNLSFNWRLILAPDFVLRYLVTHEAVHLVVLNHSPRFWLTVQSLCADANQARLWLAKHGRDIFLNPIDRASHKSSHTNIRGTLSAS